MNRSRFVSAIARVVICSYVLEAGEDLGLLLDHTSLGLEPGEDLRGDAQRRAERGLCGDFGVGELHLQRLQDGARADDLGVRSRRGGVVVVGEASSAQRVRSALVIVRRRVHVEKEPLWHQRVDAPVAVDDLRDAKLAARAHESDGFRFRDALRVHQESARLGEAVRQSEVDRAADGEDVGRRVQVRQVVGVREAVDDVDVVVLQKRKVDRRHELGQRGGLVEGDAELGRHRSLDCRARELGVALGCVRVADDEHGAGDLDLVVHRRALADSPVVDVAAKGRRRDGVGAGDGVVRLPKKVIVGVGRHDCQDAEVRPKRDLPVELGVEVVDHASVAKAVRLDRRAVEALRVEYGVRVAGHGLQAVVVVHNMRDDDTRHPIKGASRAPGVRHGRVRVHVHGLPPAHLAGGRLDELEHRNDFIAAGAHGHGPVSLRDAEVVAGEFRRVGAVRLAGDGVLARVQRKDVDLDDVAGFRALDLHWARDQVDSRLAKLRHGLLLDGVALLPVVDFLRGRVAADHLCVVVRAVVRQNLHRESLSGLDRHQRLRILVKVPPYDSVLRRLDVVVRLEVLFDFREFLEEARPARPGATVERKVVVPALDAGVALGHAAARGGVRGDPGAVLGGVPLFVPCIDVHAVVQPTARSLALVRQRAALAVQDRRRRAWLRHGLLVVFHLDIRLLGAQALRVGGREEREAQGQ
mmetsp:Transcript_15068/g.50597  ORF Transcript_15068/g.50597 Transcript_15068/m.50597 type:complete len:696 (+) Transcript_15068:128-2215(+)